MRLRHTLSVWTTYDLGGGWEIGGGVQGAGKRYGSNTNTNYVPATRWDAEVAYSLTGFRRAPENVRRPDRAQWYRPSTPATPSPAPAVPRPLSVDCSSDPP
ncbi:hypothetical protein [Plasticicumulans sp.]|uniref:hypothetical protein n=1 Tax=Plasticicumulans sp. TaxID=2307179 RepID=UPI0039647B31